MSGAEFNFDEILKNVAQASDLSDWHYSVHNFESIGQNYFGVLVPLHLTGTSGKGKKVTLSLVLKLAPTDKRYRISDAITRMFNRETFTYKVVFEKYREIQEKIPTTPYVLPKCYYICQKYCEEAIVMQDMREDGYKPYSGTFLDLDHILVSVKSLAKLHALSFLLKQIDNKLYHEIEQICVPLNDITDKRFMEVINDRLLKALDKFANTKYVTLLATLKENCLKYIKQAAESAGATCLCHGDIWKENILFKYEDSKPVETCLIDYQTSRTCSPAYDVLYLITSSTDYILRQSHLNQLLDCYYDTFENYIKTAGLNTRVVYPRTMFNDDLRVVAPACLIVANTAIWLSSGLQQEGHVRSKQIITTDVEKANAEQKYKTTIKSIMDDYYSYGYLNI